MFLWLVLLGLAQGAAAAAVAAVSDWQPSPSAQGVSNRVETPHLSAQLIAESSNVPPGAAADLALVFWLRPGWHTYWKNPGDSGEAPRIDWQLPAGAQVGPIRWPYPERIQVGPLANYGYSGRALHLINLRVPADWPPGEPLEVRAQAHWLVCKEACIPEQRDFVLRLDTREAAGAAEPVGPSDQRGGRATTPGQPVGDARLEEQTRAELFAQAQASLPQPGALPATLRRSADALQLRIGAARLPDQATSVHFFADEWGLIEHAAPQSWALEGQDLVMTLTPGAAASVAAPTGVLVVTAVDGVSAYQIAPSMGPLSPAAPVPAQVATAPPFESNGAATTGFGALSLPIALLFAFVGGLILNLMPCVFPVLAIKAFSLAQQGTQGLPARLGQGLAYSAGVLSLFAAIAGLLLVLRAGGASLGWGFQLQSPVFVTLMTYLFLILGLGLSGGLTLGIGLMGLGGALQGAPPGQRPLQMSAQRHLGAFLTGALAALVAAPCTAPFMGAAVGYAIAQPWPVALAVILMLGLGMALPFAALTVSPGLARRLPRPGPWMENLKQFLAFPMFATAAWLLWVLSQQLGPVGLASVLTGMLLLVFGLWLRERSRSGAGLGSRAAALTGLGCVLFALVLALTLAPEPPPLADGRGQGTEGHSLQAQPFSAERLRQARAAGRPVFVNMTAAWCITCLVNERVALDRAAVAQAFAEHQVRYLKGDWTNRDPVITDYLAQFQRNGVPFYVYYPVNGEPQVLPQVLTESLIVETLSSARDGP